MKKLIELKPYIPDEPSFGYGVCYLQCKEGNDWYKSLSEFSTETIKIVFNKDGVVCAASEDVSMLWPVNMSVIEVSKMDIPDGFLPDGTWVFDGSVIYQNKAVVNKREQHDKNITATIVITPLQDAVDAGIATPGEEVKLMEWKKYRALVSRVDTSQDEITWPAQPDQ
ncbi:tail fiber assembly protein [Serratia marcescens]|uniref:tail fiber assembly protein n=1 Tax=Serratia marcescens TaxID=615 RepID=UPI0032049F89